MADEKGKKSLRLIPPDISESLGKLPPQALELEMSVLGALMLEAPALPQVKDILKVEHFYTEAHKEVYNAILAVASAGNPVDMRTVIHQLRTTGKIDMVGGAHYISELTSTVSSAANIRYHTAVVVEMGIKRLLIQLASKIHQQIYEEDVFEVLDKVTAEFEFLKKHHIPANNDARVKELWKTTMIIEEPEELPPLLTLDGAPIATRGNHSLVVGKKKSRKTLFIAWLISEYLKTCPANANRVILFDTEQGKKHVYALRSKIHQLSGLWVPIFYLRGMAPEERRDFIRSTVALWENPPVWLVIDGIRDLMSNINDPDESTQTIVWLEKLTLLHNVHVTNILHLNKTDNNARGHIGSELLNKAEVTIEMEIDEKNGCTIVKCESSREKPFDTFAFTHDSNGLPIIVGTPIKGTIVPIDEKRRRLNDIFEGESLKYTQLVEDIRNHFEVGANKAKSMITDFLRQGYIVKNGKSGGKDTIYKLLSSNGHHPEPKSVQTSLDLSQNGHKVEEKVAEVEIIDDLPF